MTACASWWIASGRGMRKSEAAIDRWLKEVTPSTKLRRWFGHDPSQREEFRHRYGVELSCRAELFSELRTIAKSHHAAAWAAASLVFDLWNSASRSGFTV
jgi:uncharacterized protein YeaO (DUF488 family)